MRRLVLSLFGVGRVQGMPGTYASAVTAVGLWYVEALTGAPPLLAALATAVLGSAATLALASPAVLLEGRGDPSWVVTDEVAGQALALVIAALLPRADFAPVVACFLLFRLFDIWKPGPIGALERLPGAVGVLADDLAAGAAAGALVLAGEAAGLFSGSLLGW